MPSNGVFVYTVVSQEKHTVRIGNNSDIHHNGIDPLALNSLEYCRIPSSINGYSVVSLGYRAISHNSVIKYVYIPRSIEKLEGDGFPYLTNLEEIVFEENSQLVDISHHTFYGCQKLKTIVFPKSVTKQTGNLFGEIKGLKNIIIQSFLHAEDKSNFLSVDTSEIRIFVPSNYPYPDFAGVLVEKVLEPFYKVRITCCKMKYDIKHIPFLILWCLSS